MITLKEILDTPIENYNIKKNTDLSYGRISYEFRVDRKWYAVYFYEQSEPLANFIRDTATNKRMLGPSFGHDLPFDIEYTLIEWAPISGPGGRSVTYGLTGEGKQSTILTGVKHCVLEYLTDRPHVNALYFSADATEHYHKGRENGRVRTYRLLSAMLAKWWGANLFITKKYGGEYVVYTLIKPIDKSYLTKGVNDTTNSNKLPLVARGRHW